MTSSPNGNEKKYNKNNINLKIKMVNVDLNATIMKRTISLH